MAGRWDLVLAFALLFAVGVGLVMWLEGHKGVVGSTQNVTAKIIDAVPSKDGIVITVEAGSKLYKIYTNATMINISDSVILHFENGKLVKVFQDGKEISVLKYMPLKTLERMPAVKG